MHAASLCNSLCNSKVLPTCTLPLTGAGVVSMLVTEFGVWRFSPEGGMLMTEIAPGIDLDSVRAATRAPFSVVDNLPLMKGSS